jgi:hypothetical protein
MSKIKKVKMYTLVVDASDAVSSRVIVINCGVVFFRIET